MSTDVVEWIEKHVADEHELTAWQLSALTDWYTAKMRGLGGMFATAARTWSRVLADLRPFLAEVERLEAARRSRISRMHLDYRRKKR